MNATNDDYGRVTEARTVRLERLLPGPIERVWSYLTDSEKRGKWFASGPMELRAGGRVAFTFNNDDLSADKDTPERFEKTRGMKMEGKVLRCEPPHVLSFTFFGSDEEPSEVTFELTPKGSEVLLVVTHRRLASRNDMVMVGAGWHTHIGVLIDILNNEEPRPFWKTFVRLEPEYEKRIAP
jgi:uncharacterized protein YndB with AHSA1/START domain